MLDLYHALGNIALVFSAILVCNSAYSAPAGRDSERELWEFYQDVLSRSLSSHLIAPTSGFGRFTGTDSMTEESIVVQMRSQSNRSWYGNLSPSG